MAGFAFTQYNNSVFPVEINAIDDAGKPITKEINVNAPPIPLYNDLLEVAKNTDKTAEDLRAIDIRIMNNNTDGIVFTEQDFESYAITGLCAFFESYLEWVMDYRNAKN